MPDVAVAAHRRAQPISKTFSREVTSARAAFNIGAFQGDVATAPPTPIQQTVFQLTEAKVNAQQTPDGYEPPAGSNLLIPWATAAGKKRKRMGDGDDDSDAAPNGDDDEEEDDDE